jgi:hypothetical protein
MAARRRSEYARIRAELDHPLAQVWSVVARFGDADVWVDGVTACAIEGEGVGAVRTLVRNGATVRERLELMDPDNHWISYLVLEPHSLPATDVRGTMVLRALGQGSTEIVWRSSADGFEVPPRVLGERIEAFYAASLRRLARLLDAPPLSAW